MSDNWKNEGQNKTDYNKDKQGGQNDPSQRPGQPGQGQNDPNQKKQDQRHQDNPSQGNEKDPQKRAS